MTPEDEPPTKLTTPGLGPLAPGEIEADRANRLRWGGIRIKEIAAALDRSERQVYRLLGSSRLLRSDFKPWSVWTSEKSHESIDATRYLFENVENAGWTETEATWAWRIHCLRPELDPRIVAAFARIYILMDYLAVKDRPFHARQVDLALKYEPWVDDKHQRRYFEFAPARNESDLRYIASVARYLKHVTDGHGKAADLVPTPITGDQVETLGRIVEQMQDELERDEAMVNLVPEPGKEESDS